MAFYCLCVLACQTVTHRARFLLDVAHDCFIRIFEKPMLKVLLVNDTPRHLGRLRDALTAAGCLRWVKF